MKLKELGEKLDKQEFRRSIKRAIGRTQNSIQIGRSFNCAGFSNSTTIEIIDGDQAPQLLGRPYLSTTYRRGSFTRNLYTPSTLRVVVGRDWRE